MYMHYAANHFIYVWNLQQDPNSIKADHATLLSNKQDENSVFYVNFDITLRP